MKNSKYLSAFLLAGAFLNASGAYAEGLAEILGKEIGGAGGAFVSSFISASVGDPTVQALYGQDYSSTQTGANQSTQAGQLVTISGQRSTVLQIALLEKATLNQTDGTGSKQYLQRVEASNGANVNTFQFLKADKLTLRQAGGAGKEQVAQSVKIVK